MNSLGDCLVMASAVAIKFRCFECNKLLGVSRSKVGAVVACPRCGAELIVPETVDEAASPETAKPEQAPPSPPPRSSPSSSRIEPVVVLWDSAPEPEPEPEPPGPPAFPVIRTEPLSLRPDPPVPYKGASRQRAEARENPQPEPSPAVPAPPRPRPAAPPSPPEADPQPVVMPVINVEPDAIRESDAPRSAGPALSLRETSARRNDVVLPRAAVMLWSFLVLLAIAFAFTSGLLAGRFLWGRGLPLPMPVGPPAARSLK